MRGGALNAVQASLWPKDKITEISQPAEEILGMAGRILYISRGMKKPQPYSMQPSLMKRGKDMVWGHRYKWTDCTFQALSKAGYIYILYGMEAGFSGIIHPFGS